MKKYKVNVNGTMYEVEIEEMSADAVAAAPKQTAAPKQEEAPAPAAPVAKGEGETISAPMPGTILSVNVNNGDAVKKGQVLMILEAMKMENEIMSPVDGVVTSVAAAKGSSVQSGDILCTIK